VVRDAVERLLQAPREMQALSLVCVCVCCAAWRVDRVPAPRNPAERAPLCAEVDPRDRGEAVGEGLACTCQRSAVACEAQGWESARQLIRKLMRGKGQMLCQATQGSGLA
jgi:hypothetical protein